jgi:hypothetical protein
MLNELQRRVARLMAGLAEADDFALAGGAALIVYGIVDRSTRDLDYFATASDAVARVVPALEAALQGDGLLVARRRDAPGFVRLEITDETQQSVVVDLAYDARLLPTQVSQLGPALHPDELAADKMLALYGRAEGRDFHDVAALAVRYPAERLLELAAAKDRGFDQRRFVEMLGAIDRLRSGDFPDPQRAEDLRAWFEQWRRELSSSLHRPGRGR